MSQIANWWFVNFLDPIIDELAKIKNEFNKNAFPLQMEQLGVYTTSQSYFKIQFFDAEKWNNLLTSGAREYFLSTFPLIEKKLTDFEKLINEFIKSFQVLEQEILKSEEYYTPLLKFYKNLIKHEQVSPKQYQDKNLTELSQLIVGQLQSNLSHHSDACKETILRNVVYFLLDLNPVRNNINYAEEKILNAGKSIAESIIDPDDLFTELIENSLRLFESVRTESVVLWYSLKHERIALAKRYTAIFG